MATYRKMWQCRDLFPAPGLVGVEFPVLSESDEEIGLAHVVEVAGTTLTFEFEIREGAVLPDAADIRALKVYRAKDDRSVVASVTAAMFRKPPGYTEPEDKEQPYARYWEVRST